MNKDTTATKSTKSKDSKATANAGKGANDSKLQKLFIDGLKDIYWAEKHLTKALPKMQKAATSQELQGAFANHLEVTNQQIARLEQAFELMERKAVAKKCDAMAGLIEEGDGIIEETEEGTSTRDVGLVLACQKIEHYEIATYGGLAQLARTLGVDQVADLLEATLAEEKEADTLLTEIAESKINYEASAE
jgi:ferritin-like metal-binding protein YciE